MLLEWKSEQSQPRIQRVLKIDPSGTDLVTIEINNPKALPIWQKCKEFEEAIAAGELCILQVDPYAVLLRPESEIPEAHRQRRDRAWEVIAPIVESQNGEAFIQSYRGSLVAEAARCTGSIKKTIYNYLRRYWQGGQTKNALLPLFDQCGGKGKERHSSSNIKRGRPSKLAKATETPLGVNVNEKMRKIFRRGIKLFYENPQGRTLKDAFQLTLERFFHKGYEMQDGVLVPVLPPASELPSFAQFRYWYEKERDISREKISREGGRRFNLRYRAVVGDSTQMAFGPGSLYQIDATVGDIYLVSSLNRSRIIGRPVIYVVIDVFSRLITGFSVSLEGPSWLGAMLALDNTFGNKVAFCEEYGVQIGEADWPIRGLLCEGILGDRGELEGYNADNLVNALNIRISNTPPYRADWKGIVEQNFRLINKKVIHWQPGAVYQRRERGDRDYRLDAVLDLNQFRRLMIWCILDHNLNHRMQWYRMDEFMIEDHVDPYPIELWNWGIRNRSGHLRTMSTEIVRLNLLPEAEASVTESGICYEGSLYTCELALREHWFVKARVKGRWKIKIAYEIRKPDIIYLRLDGGRSLEACHLIDKIFKGRDWYEVLDYLELQKQAKESATTRQQQTTASLHARVDKLVSEATEQTENSIIGQSKRSRLQGIQENRKLEREHEREIGAWQLGTEDIAKESAQIIPMLPTVESEDDDEEYIAPPKPTDKLRKLREKHWNND
jgi:hypothetical protein